MCRPPQRMEDSIVYAGLDSLGLTAHVENGVARNSEEHGGTYQERVQSLSLLVNSF